MDMIACDKAPWLGEKLFARELAKRGLGKRGIQCSPLPSPHSATPLATSSLFLLVSPSSGACSVRLFKWQCWKTMHADKRGDPSHALKYSTYNGISFKYTCMQLDMTAFWLSLANWSMTHAYPLLTEHKEIYCFYRAVDSSWNIQPNNAYCNTQDNTA